jgi:excinuclease ABC subunit C
MSELAETAFDGKAFAARLSTAPGVYRMYAADGGVLYVGKAGPAQPRVQLLQRHAQERASW